MKTPAIRKVVIVVVAALVAVVWNGCSREGGGPAYKTIHQAAKAGDAEAVAAFLKSNAELVNAKDGQGFLPLHIAAAEGHKAVVELLLANKADVNAIAPEGRTALHLAVAKRHKAVVELLLANKADVNAKNEFGWTPLHLAANDGYKETVELLLAHNADVEAKTNKGNTALNLAAKKEPKEVMELLQKTPSAEQKGGGTTAGGSGTIHEAAEQGNIERLKELLKADPKLISTRDGKGRTPLFSAVIKKQKAAVELLLENGADVNALLPNGFTCLHLAAYHGHIEEAKLLLEKKPNVNVRGGDPGWTPISVAAGRGFAEIVQLLAAHGADPNAKDKGGFTPLLTAIASDKSNPQAIEALLKAGANPNLAGPQGLTPMKLASQQGKQDLIPLLRRYGARR